VAAVAEILYSIAVLVLVVKTFKLMEVRAQHRQQTAETVQQPAASASVRALEDEVQAIKQEVAEMRAAFTERLVELQSEVRYLRGRVQYVEAGDSPASPSASAEAAGLERNLGERA